MRKNLINAVVLATVAQALVGCIGKGRPPVRISQAGTAQTPSTENVAQGSQQAREQTPGSLPSGTPAAQASGTPIGIVTPEGMEDVFPEATQRRFRALEAQFEVKKVILAGKEYDVDANGVLSSSVPAVVSDDITAASPMDPNKTYASFAKGAVKGLEVIAQGGRVNVILQRKAGTEADDKWAFGDYLSFLSNTGVQAVLFVATEASDEEAKKQIQLHINTHDQDIGVIKVIMQKKEVAAEEQAPAAPAAVEAPAAPAVEAPVAE